MVTYKELREFANRFCKTWTRLEYSGNGSVYILDKDDSVLREIVIETGEILAALRA